MIITGPAAGQDAGPNNEENSTQTSETTEYFVIMTGSSLDLQLAADDLQS